MTGSFEIIKGALKGSSVRWVLSQIVKNPAGVTLTQIDVLLDVSQNLSLARPGSVTDRPIETGTTITDHVRLDPRRVDLTFYLTPDPTGITLASVFKTDVDERAEIIEAWRDGVVILTLTGRQVIDNLVIESLTERSDGLRDSRMFDIVMRQVTIADTDAASQAGLGTKEPQNEVTPI